jgi:hypothetical protein
MAIKKAAYDEPSYFWEGVVIAIVAVIALFLLAAYKGFVP